MLNVKNRYEKKIKVSLNIRKREIKKININGGF